MKIKNRQQVTSRLARMIIGRYKVTGLIYDDRPALFHIEDIEEDDVFTVQISNTSVVSLICDKAEIILKKPSSLGVIKGDGIKIPQHYIEI